MALVLASCGSAKTPHSATTSGSTTSAGTPVPALAAAHTYGTGSADELLILAPPAVGDKPLVPESVARNEVDHPDSAPMLLGPAAFTLARATASMLGWSGGAEPSFDSTLAWAGVFEVDLDAPHSCPAQPPSPPFPPLEAHYYFVVLVDATTGAQATWNEDMSGRLLRQCAGLSSSPAGKT